jgi:hypothetical protein
VAAATLVTTVRSILLTCWLAVIAIAGAVWILPLEVAQNWAVDRAAKDDFARFEAYGATTATVWFVRVAAVLAVILLAVAWTRRDRFVPFLSAAVSDLWQAVGPTASIRLQLARLFVAAWLILAMVHAGTGVGRRLWEWPLYQLHSGKEILPNISDTNREVIRYVAAATPPDARILVVSDQKLFFLSYYLLPRRLYHRQHPDSEFVIPQAHNQRHMAAYQLNELTPEDIARNRPDFVLEYFEGAAYVKDQDLTRDRSWLAFERQRHGPDWQPTGLVQLRRYAAEGSR